MFNTESLFGIIKRVFLVILCEIESENPDTSSLIKVFPEGPERDLMNSLLEPYKVDSNLEFRKKIQNLMKDETTKFQRISELDGIARGMEFGLSMIKARNQNTQDSTSPVDKNFTSPADIICMRAEIEKVISEAFNLLDELILSPEEREAMCMNKSSPALDLRDKLKHDMLNNSIGSSAEKTASSSTSAIPDEKDNRNMDKVLNDLIAQKHSQELNLYQKIYGQ